ncbi:MAG: ParB/RepB/Spo0J family partition protein [Marinifilaceae bacterium]
MAKKSVLGKGLGALISDAIDEPVSKVQSVASIQELHLDEIHPNPFQPRKEFDQEALAELAASIKSLGIVQPITVRSLPQGGYEIIAGERRYRASKLAGLETIPAYIRDTTSDSILELALVENIQREDLNAIEVAISYQRLLEECNLTQDALSERVGMKRATVANYIRLLKLPAQIQLALRDKKITMGHARALLAIENPEQQFIIFEQILKYDFSVRKVEELVRNGVSAPPAAEKERVKQPSLLAEYEALQQQLSKRFDTKIDLKRNDKGQGKIVIAFKSDNELERILGLFDKLD